MNDETKLKARICALEKALDIGNDKEIKCLVTIDDLYIKRIEKVFGYYIRQLEEVRKDYNL
ncbi:MAG TPA: hypothetical protein ENG87_05775 [Candidatus Pacearchaeota archaeon]|nr:hypothetical protein BMS3Abin17_00518 [archaeon BMS3Abin17]HDK42864.1 hypothetical protein [Candidatus Pacearchaeota archaeon]HDZ61110.1 hypothetical protein [Candidatus Pacearchaeota archaeon]